jgi:D-sedoheptulose 7-phosphate isomerase
MENFLNSYFALYKKALFDGLTYDNFIKTRDLLATISKNGNKALIQGNGASAAIASHCALDLTKQAKVRTLSFNETSLITAFVNDYGSEEWLEKAFQAYSDKNDVAILISSSGTSKNIVNAAKWIKQSGMKLVTFTGFSYNNPVKELGDINFWVDSKAYNVIECSHMIWLTTVIDMLIGKAEYSVN